MQAEDYILIHGKSVKILRTNDRFVFLDNGNRLTWDEAATYKVSSSGLGGPDLDGRAASKPVRQLGLFLMVGL